MDTRDLKIFTVAFESSSFNSAAQKVFITPQGLAKIINKLEAELDAPLFIRSANGISPTIYGKKLYQRVRELDYLLHDVASIKGAYAAEKTLLSVYATNGAFYYLGYEFFRKYQDIHPDIAFNLVEIPDSFLNEQFLEKEYHLGFLAGPVNPIYFDSVFVASVSQCLIMHPDHPVASLPKVKAADLEGYPIAILGREYSAFRAHHNMLIDQRLSPNVVLETSNDSLIFEFAAGNRGIGFIQKNLLSRTVCKASVEAGEVAVKELEDVNMTKDIYFVSNIKTELTQEETAFAEYVRSCMEVSSVPMPV